MHQGTLPLRVIGFIAALILTLAAYFIIISPAFFQLDNKQAILIILLLAVTQSIVQFIFFLYLWGEKEPAWNLGTFFSTFLLVFIIIFFSIWIMNRLNYNMMP